MLAGILETSSAVLKPDRQLTQSQFSVFQLHQRQLAGFVCVVTKLLVSLVNFRILTASYIVTQFCPVRRRIGQEPVVPVVVILPLAGTWFSLSHGSTHNPITCRGEAFSIFASQQQRWQFFVEQMLVVLFQVDEGSWFHRFFLKQKRTCKERVTYKLNQVGEYLFEMG